MLSSSNVSCVNFFHRQEELCVSAAPAVAAAASGGGGGGASAASSSAAAAAGVGTAHILAPSCFKDILKQTCRMLRPLLWTAES